jgi:hypothetical protein
VIELLGDILPVVVVVALKTSRTEPVLVRILMARHAGSGNAEESPAHISNFDHLPLGGSNVFRAVAAVTTEAGMLAFKRIAGLLVIEVFLIPSSEGEVETVVLRMAARALLTRPGLDSVGSMQPAVGSQALSDFGVTLQAFEHRLPASQFVATGALRGAIQRLMSSRERSRRYLRTGETGGQKQQGGQC